MFGLTSKISLIVFFLTAGLSVGFGQSLGEMKISGEFENQPASSILNTIAESHAVSFYFKNEDLPEKTYTVDFESNSLEFVLNYLFSNERLGYFYYRDYAVVLLPKDILQEVYTANYYKALQASSEASDKKRSSELIIGDIKLLKPSGSSLITGRVIDDSNREPIIGATIMLTNLGEGTATDFDGRFEMNAPVGNHDMLVQYIGFEDYNKKIKVYSDGDVRIRMNKSAIDLEAVSVSARSADASVDQVQVGLTSLDIKSLDKTPAFMGEKDIVKNLLLLPGVSSIGEGATGFNVRGGQVDQNLIQQDDGILFNSSHALGFFSTFNSDLINRVDLFKGNIPAEFGGRIASVMDVEMRDGNFEEYKILAGVGPISAKMSIEGPIVKEKASFIAGFRSTYSDWILGQFKVPEVSRSSAFFYDGNLRFTIRPNPKNTFILSGYSTRDDFVYNDQFGFDYSTLMGQFSYKKIFNDKWFNKLTFTANRYESAQSQLNGLDASRLANQVDYFKLKEQLNYLPNKDFRINMGFSSILYEISPGNLSPYGDSSEIVVQNLETQKGLESAAFISTNYDVSAAFTISAGLRFSTYQFLGPKTVFQYEDPENPLPTTLTDSLTYANNERIASYSNFEPRISMRYKFSPQISIKAGYSRTAQYINQIFNSDSPTPASLWQLSTNYITPNKSHNASLGYFQNFRDNTWESSIEVYGRLIDDLYDYKDFAQLAVNPRLETEILGGIGRSYGAELSVKKREGVFNGWLSYTLSKSEYKINGINRDNWYPSSFDKTHDLSMVFNWSPNRRNTFTINFNYSTGRPSTSPFGSYETPEGIIVPVYSLRNQTRIPDYHRLDFAYTRGRGYKKNKKIRTSWTFSIYNIYGRDNAFSVFYTRGAFDLPQANRLAVVGAAIPSLTFNFEFL